MMDFNYIYNYMLDGRDKINACLGEFQSDEQLDTIINMANSLNEMIYFWITGHRRDGIYISRKERRRLYDAYKAIMEEVQGGLDLACHAVQVVNQSIQEDEEIRNHIRYAPYTKIHGYSKHISDDDNKS